jgi:predicted nucleic acid-binding protein
VSCDLIKRHGLDVWDSIVIAASQLSGCRTLLSEDLQDGFVWNGVTICNPFAPDLHPLLTSLLGD